MSNFTLADLEALATPGIIETLDFETILAARKAKFVEQAAAFGLAYDVDELETDPAIILLQEAAYKEVLLRARGNDIARARYLYFAIGTEIDHLGAFYDCPRLPNEADDRYKLRIILAIQARSTGGTEARYRLIALSSSLRVADALPYRIGRSPKIYVAVFAADNNGVADAGLLATVTAALNDQAARMLNDTIEVRSAVVEVVNVTADVWLLPSSDESLLTTIVNSVPSAWAAVYGLGRDLTRSWLVSKIMVLGVQRVEITAPTTDRVVSPYEAVRIGTLTLTNRGRDY